MSHVKGGIEDCFQLSFCADRIIWRAARAEEALSKLGKKYFVLFNTFDDSGPLHLFYCSTNLTVCQQSTISQGSQSVSNWCVTMDWSRLSSDSTQMLRALMRLYPSQSACQACSPVSAILLLCLCEAAFLLLQWRENKIIISPFHQVNNVGLRSSWTKIHNFTTAPNQQSDVLSVDKLFLVGFYKGEHLETSPSVCTLTACPL